MTRLQEMTHSRHQAMDTINRLHGEALQIRRAAQALGKYNKHQCTRMLAIAIENAAAKEVLNRGER